MATDSLIDHSKDWTEWKKTELLALPDRKSSETVYDSVLIVPTRTKHDSGFARIAIIGVLDRVPVEIAAYPDDINWHFHEAASALAPLRIAAMRTDCSMHGVLQVWARGRFKVGAAFSSTDIELIPRDRKSITK